MSIEISRIELTIRSTSVLAALASLKLLDNLIPGAGDILPDIVKRIVNKFVKELKKYSLCCGIVRRKDE